MMAAPTTRMRLTVEVLPLVPENARGPRRSDALAAFTKSRKFALPVELEHTIEHVWRQIEERYKRNYLDDVEAACFSIKKLQDAYECDLDVGDTVGAIFEGETDPQNRVIKVVLSFINRDFSMPATSNLRPVSAQKRPRESSEARESKRQRMEEEQLDLMQLDDGRDQPMVSTESEQSEGGATRDSSIVLTHDTQTGNEEFGIHIKEESPELGLPPSHTNPKSPVVFKKPAIPPRKSASTNRQPARSLSRTPRRQLNGIHTHQSPHPSKDDQSTAVQAHDESDETLVEHGSTPSPSVEDTTEAAIRESPMSTSTPERTENYSSQESARQGVFREASEAPFMKKSGLEPRVSYGRTSEVDLLNNARTLSASGQKKVKRSDANVESAPEGTSASTPRRYSRHINGITTPDTNEEFANNTHIPDDQASFGSAGRLSTTGSLPRPGSLSRPVSRAYNMQTRGPTSSLKQKTRLSKTPRPRADSDYTSKGTTQSISKSPVDKATHTPESQVVGPRQERRSSPKVVINVRTPARAGLTTGAQEGSHAPVLSHVMNGSSSQNSITPSAPVESSGVKQHEAAPVMTVPSSRPQKTPIPLPILGKNVTPPSVPRRTPIPPPILGRNLPQSASSQSSSIASIKKPLATQTSAKKGARKSEAKDKAVKKQDAQPTLSNGRLSADPAQFASTVKDVYDVPDSDPPIERPSAVRTSTTKAQTRTPIPLPENVKHLNMNGNMAKVRPFNAGSENPKKQNSRSLSTSVPNLEKTSTVNIVTTPEITKKQSLAIRSAQKGKADDAIVLSSRDTSSASSDSNNVEEEASTTVNKKTPRLKKQPLAVDGAGESEKKVHKKKVHRQVMKKVFPGGQERLRQRKDPVREHFGPRPADPVSRVSDVDSTAVYDVESLAGAPIERDSSADVNSQTNNSAVERGSSADVRSTSENSAADDQDASADAHSESDDSAAVERDSPADVRSASENSAAVDQDSSADVHSEPDNSVDVEGHAPTDVYSQLENAAAVDSVEYPAIDRTGEPSTSNLDMDQTLQEETAANTTPWNAESWGFGRLEQPNGTIEQEEASKSPSGSPSRSESGPLFEPENAANDEMKSKSASPVSSTRSSPEVSRRPARYLSHSPTPENPDSDDDSDTSASPSRSPSRAAFSKVASANEDSESDSSDSIDDSIEDDITDDEDTEMPDADKVASSPPRTSALPTTLIPATQSSQLQNLSQPVPRRNPNPLSTTNTPIVPATQPTPFGPSSSQSVSEAAASRATTASRRPIYSKFPSIAEQLMAARAAAASSLQKKKMDPRTGSFGKMDKKPGKVMHVSDSSEDEESSNSDSGEEEQATSKNPNSQASCSVA